MSASDVVPASPRWTLAALGWCALLAGSSCAPDEPARASSPTSDVLEGRDLPEGTVLLVAGIALTAAEVAPLTRDILELYPEYSPLHARRLALTNEFLPRLAARAQDPEGWSRAREACERAEGLDGSAHEVEGGFHALGLALWSLARHQTPGAWSEPLELTGRWLRVRLESRSPHPDSRQEVLRFALVEFPFIAPQDVPAGIEAAIDRSALTLVDPAFAEAVPEAWKHRMHATTP